MRELGNIGEKDTENEVLLYYIITGSLCERAGQHWREGHGE